MSETRNVTVKANLGFEDVNDRGFKNRLLILVLNVVELELLAELLLVEFELLNELLLEDVDLVVGAFTSVVVEVVVVDWLAFIGNLIQD